jgi:isopentenyldiphosphate isomerase
VELFDILDRDGNPTGRVAPKGSALQENQFYLGVHAYLCNAHGEYLLQRRTNTKDFLPGGWEIHMGHAIAGETSVVALQREISEEIGIQVDEHEIEQIMRLVWDEYHHMVDVFWICKDVPLAELKLQASEVEAVKYVSKEEMLELVKRMTYRPEAYRETVYRFLLKKV